MDKENATTGLIRITKCTADDAKMAVNSMLLNDLRKLAQAVNDNDTKIVNSIYNTYKRVKLPDAEEVQKMFDDEFEDTMDKQESIVRVADFFGITGEEVNKLLKKKVESFENEYDAMVNEAFINLQYCIEHGSAKSRPILKELNMRQRRILYRFVPDQINDYLDSLNGASPKDVMLYHAWSKGWDNVGPDQIKESTEVMKDDLIEFVIGQLNKHDDAKALIVRKILKALGMKIPDEVEGWNKVVQE